MIKLTGNLDEKTFLELIFVGLEPFQDYGDVSEKNKWLVFKIYGYNKGQLVLKNEKLYLTASDIKRLKEGIEGIIEGKENEIDFLSVEPDLRVQVKAVNNEYAVNVKSIGKINLICDKKGLESFIKGFSENNYAL